MLASRNIDDLRPDVAANCRELLARAAAQGLDVLITQTVRDEEYQRSLYAQGRTRPGSIVTGTPVPSFHSVRAGLAFDFCKNEKGHEYDDAAFFARVGAIGKALGFSWGGDWKEFSDRPHLQWDAHGACTAAMVRAGRYPPDMPVQEEETMTQQQFNAMMETYLRTLAKKEPSAWSAEARAWAEKNGIFTGDEAGRMQYRSFLTREQMAVLLQRLHRL